MRSSAAGGAEAVEQHGLGAGENRLHQGQITPVEAERQPDHHHVAGVKPEIAVQDARGGERGVVAVHDPFGIARRPRGEGHPHHRIGVGRRGHEIGRRAARGGNVVEAHHAGARRAADDADHGEIGKPRPQLFHHGEVIEIAKPRAADEHPAARETHDVFDLAAAEVDADRHRHRAEALEGEEDERELDPVRQLDGDDIALTDAERAQPRRHAVDAVGEFAVGQPALAVGQRLAVRRLAHPARQHRGESLVAPQAGAAPARGHRRCQTRFKGHAPLPRHAAMIWPPSTCSTLPVM